MMTTNSQPPSVAIAEFYAYDPPKLIITLAPSNVEACHAFGAVVCAAPAKRYRFSHDYLQVFWSSKTGNGFWTSGNESAILPPARSMSYSGTPSPTLARKATAQLPSWTEILESPQFVL